MSSNAVHPSFPVALNIGLVWGYRGNENGGIPVHSEDSIHSMIKLQWAVLECKITGLPIIEEAKFRSDNLVCAYLQNFAKEAFILFLYGVTPCKVHDTALYGCLNPIDDFCWGNYFTVGNVSGVKLLKHVKILYTLVSDKAENKTQLAERWWSRLIWNVWLLGWTWKSQICILPVEEWELRLLRRFWQVHLHIDMYVWSKECFFNDSSYTAQIWWNFDIFSRGLNNFDLERAVLYPLEKFCRSFTRHSGSQKCSKCIAIRLQMLCCLKWYKYKQLLLDLAGCVQKDNLHIWRFTCKQFKECFELYRYSQQNLLTNKQW